MKASEFLDEIAALGATLRANIEANCSGWDNSEAAIKKRVAAVLDKVSGFEYFVENYFPHYIRHPSRSNLHDYLFGRLPEILTQKEGQLEAIAAPRGESKSTIVSQLYTLYRVVTQQTHYSLIVMDSIDQAYPMLEAIKAELEANPRLRIDFPDAAGTGRVWQAGTIITANDIKIQVAGANKKLRGLRHGARRPDCVILDDIENDENVRKPEQRDKLHSWLKKTIMPLGAAGEKLDIIYIGTILHYDSVLNRVLNSPAWRASRFQALVTMPSNMQLWDEWEALYQAKQLEAAEQFYVTHKKAMDAGAVVSWAARPLLALMKIRARDGHEAFDCEYQNDPSAGDSAPFKDAIHYWSSLPRGLSYFGVVDPSLGRQGAGRDPSAILVGGYDAQEGKLYVIEAQIKKRLPDQIIEDVIALQARYNCAHWAVESTQFQEFLRTELVKRSAKRGLHVPAHGVMPHTDKLLRIESLQPHMKNALILLHSSLSTLISQLLHFPKADHDDGPDALQMLWVLATSFARSAQMQVLDIPEPDPYF